MQQGKDGTCYLQSTKEACVNAFTKVCNSCSIQNGNPKFNLKFSTYKVESPEPMNVSGHNKFIAENKAVEDKILKSQIIILQDDAEDESNFVEFVSPEIVHSQTNNSHFHKHYIMNDEWLGTRCYICFNKIVGATVCKNCEMIYSAEL